MNNRKNKNKNKTKAPQNKQMKSITLGKTIIISS